MDGDRGARLDQLERLHRPRRVEVPGGKPRAPAGHWQEGDVDLAQIAHLREQVGVAGEVHGPAPADHIADRLRPRRTHAPSRRVLGVGHSYPHIADAHLVAANDFPDRTEPAPAQEPTGTGGDETQGVPVESFERGKVAVVVVDVRDEDDVGAVERRRID